MLDVLARQNSSGILTGLAGTTLERQGILHRTIPARIAWQRRSWQTRHSLMHRARGVFDSASVFPVPRKPTQCDGWERSKILHMRTASTDRECLNSTRSSGTGRGTIHRTRTFTLQGPQAACIFRCSCSGHHCPAFRLGGDHALQYHSSAS